MEREECNGCEYLSGKEGGDETGEPFCLFSDLPCVEIERCEMEDVNDLQDMRSGVEEESLPLTL